MKKLIITSAIFIVIILTSIFALTYTNKQCALFLKYAKTIEKQVLSNNFQTAQQNLKILDLNYAKCQNKMPIFVDRAKLGQIQKILKLIQLNLNFQNKQPALLNICKIKNLFHKIKNDSTPSFCTVL